MGKISIMISDYMGSAKLIFMGNIKYFLDVLQSTSTSNIYPFIIQMKKHGNLSVIIKIFFFKENI